jgi:hypothetical protein
MGRKGAKTVRTGGFIYRVFWGASCLATIERLLCHSLRCSGQWSAGIDWQY